MVTEKKNLGCDSWSLDPIRRQERAGDTAGSATRRAASLHGDALVLLVLCTALLVAQYPFAIRSATEPRRLRMRRHFLSEHLASLVVLASLAGELGYFAVLAFALFLVAWLTGSNLLAWGEVALPEL